MSKRDADGPVARLSALTGSSSVHSALSEGFGNGDGTLAIASQGDVQGDTTDLRASYEPKGEHMSTSR
jgi:hypothetical protein